MRKPINWKSCPKCNSHAISVERGRQYCCECGTEIMEDNIVLQLLVIDLGDTTVVKAEKGSTVLKCGGGEYHILQGYVQSLPVTFANVETALNSSEPYFTEDGKHYRLHYSYGRGLTIEQDALDALAQIVGMPIPIKPAVTGTWEKIAVVGQYDPSTADKTRIVIWRYTRYVDS